LSFNLLLSFLLLLLKLLGLLFRMVLITVGRTATRTRASSLLFLLLFVLLLLLDRNFSNNCRSEHNCRSDNDDLFAHHYARQGLILRRYVLSRSIRNNSNSWAIFCEVHVSFEWLQFMLKLDKLTTWRVLVALWICYELRYTLFEGGTSVTSGFWVVQRLPILNL
jgi:hypothetical protein